MTTQHDAGDLKELDDEARQVALQRLSRFALTTTRCLADVPSRASDFELTLLGSGWAQQLCQDLDLIVSVQGSPPSLGSLIVANHRSYLDVIALLSATPCAFVADKHVRTWPIIGPAARRAGTIFVDPNRPESRKTASTLIQTRLSEGIQVAIFPGGATARPDAGIFKIGGFVAACAVNAPVIPVAIEYKHPEATWNEELSFVPHFLRTFQRPTIEVVVAFGPVVSGSEPEITRASSQNWVQNRLDAMHRRTVT